MGVRGLSSYLSSHPASYDRITLSKDCKLYIDGNGLYHYLCGRYRNELDLLCGGEYVLYRDIVLKFLEPFLLANMSLTVVMDGIKLENKAKTRLSRVHDKVQRLIKYNHQLQNSLNNSSLNKDSDPTLSRTALLSEINFHCESSLLPVSELYSIALVQTIGELKNIRLLNSLGENDEYLCGLCVYEEGFAVIGQDSDFVIYDMRWKDTKNLSYYIPLDSIIIQDDNTIQCSAYNIIKTSQFLDLPICYLPTFASLLGNDFHCNLDKFHNFLMKNSHLRSNSHSHLSRKKRGKHFSVPQLISCLLQYLRDKSSQFNSIEAQSRVIILHKIMEEIFGIQLSSSNNKNNTLLLNNLELFIKSQQKYNLNRVLQQIAVEGQNKDREEIILDCGDNFQIGIYGNIYKFYTNCKISSILFTVLYSKLYQENISLLHINNSPQEISSILRPIRISLYNYAYKILKYCNNKSIDLLEFSLNNDYIPRYNRVQLNQKLINTDNNNNIYSELLGLLDTGYFHRNSFNLLLLLPEKYIFISILICGTIIYTAKFGKSRINSEIMIKTMVLLYLSSICNGIIDINHRDLIYIDNLSFPIYIFTELYQLMYYFVELLNISYNSNIFIANIGSFFSGTKVHYIYKKLCEKYPIHEIMGLGLMEEEYDSIAQTLIKSIQNNQKYAIDEENILFHTNNNTISNNNHNNDTNTNTYIQHFSLCLYNNYKCPTQNCHCHTVTVSSSSSSN